MIENAKISDQRTVICGLNVAKIEAIPNSKLRANHSTSVLPEFHLLKATEEDWMNINNCIVNCDWSLFDDPDVSPEALNLVIIEHLCTAISSVLTPINSVVPSTTECSETRTSNILSQSNKKC
jgi:hypothetical protein